MGGWRWAKQSGRGFLAAILMGAPALAQEPVAEAESSSDDPVVAEASSSAPVVVDAASSSPLATEPAQNKPKGEKAEPLSERPDAASEAVKLPPVRVFGRVYVRASADERDEYKRALSVPSARVGVSATFEHVEAEVNADLSSKALLKDAFVRLADGKKRLRLYGGQFKAPFLERTLESSWRLPLVRRGLVEDYLVETHQLGGRRLGLMGEVRLKELWGLKVSGGLFQGALDEETEERLSEDAAMRVSVRPLQALTLGASSYLTQVTEGIRHHALATDATLQLGDFALSGEFVTGRLALGPFTAQLAMASFTVPLSKDWALQPVAGGEVLQLRGDMAGRGWSVVGGLNFLLTDTFKAQFQVERALRPGDEAPGLEYLLQLATRF